MCITVWELKGLCELHPMRYVLNLSHIWYIVRGLIAAIVPFLLGERLGDYIMIYIMLMYLILVMVMYLAQMDITVCLLS